MKVLIVEDETLAVERLSRLLREIEDTIEIAGVTNSIVSTVEWLRTHPQPELILMDIELADGQSFDIFKRIEIQSPVIFTTSYDEYALSAFKVNSIDYLLKPVDRDELRGSIQKFRSLSKRVLADPETITHLATLVQNLTPQPSEVYKERFLVKTGTRYRSLEIDQIAYFYSEERVSYIRTWKDEAFIVDYPLDALEQMLPPKLFFRANRQFIVHAKAVNSISDYFNNKLLLTLTPPSKYEVIISRDRAMPFKIWMGK